MRYCFSKVWITLCLIVFIPCILVAQLNDNCADALVLAVTTQCASKPYTNRDATSEALTIAGDPSCGTYSGADVWFKLALPSTGALRVEVDNLNGATPPSFTLYSGTCGNFTEVECVRNDKAKTIVRPELAKDVIYIRVYSFFSTTGIDFSLCAYEPVIPANDLCAEAIEIEVDEGCNLATYTNANATAEPNDVAANPFCGFYKGGDIWFKVVMPAAGVLHINKNRIGGAANPSIALYAGSCGNLTELFCSGNEATETFANTTYAQQTLLIRVYSFNTEEGFSFSLCFFEQAEPANDKCENAQSLSLGEGCSSISGTTFLATSESSVKSDPSCGFYKGADVWYTFTLPESGSINLDIESLNSTVPPSFALYTGTCAGFEEVACVNNVKHNIFSSPALAGETVYLRVYPFNSDDGGLFSLCVFESAIVGLQEAQDISVVLFPNPVENVLYINSKNTNQHVYFDLLDLMGRSLKNKTLMTSPTHTINMVDVVSGTYLLRIFHASGSNTYKVVKR